MTKRTLEKVMKQLWLKFQPNQVNLGYREATINGNELILFANALDLCSIY